MRLSDLYKFILCIYTFPYIVRCHSCATRNKIVFVKVGKTGREQFAFAKTNHKLQGTGHEEGGGS